MSNNQQPFSPPLTAEERDAWDLVYMGCCVQNTVESSAKHADEAIHERRRRFGVPGPTAQDLCAQELFRKVCDKSEIDTLRAEVERLTKDAQVRENVYRIRCEQVDALVSRAEKAEAELAAARPVLGAVMEWFDPSGDGQTHANYSTLRAYADAQRAARAAKEGGAS